MRKVVSAAVLLCSVFAIPPDTLRDLFFATPAAGQLLFNFGMLLAQKLAVKTPASAATE